MIQERERLASGRNEQVPICNCQWRWVQRAPCYRPSRAAGPQLANGNWSWVIPGLFAGSFVNTPGKEPPEDCRHIVEAIEAGDADLAGKRMSEHLAGRWKTRSFAGCSKRSRCKTAREARCEACWRRTSQPTRCRRGSGERCPSAPTPHGCRPSAAERDAGPFFQQPARKRQPGGRRALCRDTLLERRGLEIRHAPQQGQASPDER